MNEFQTLTTHSFIHSFIHLLNKAIVKSALKCTAEQDSKDKALTAAQKLKLHKNYTSNRN